MPPWRPSWKIASQDVSALSASQTAPERCSMFREHLGVGAVDNYHLDAIRQPFDVRGQLETGTEVFIGNT